MKWTHAFANAFCALAHSNHWVMAQAGDLILEHNRNVCYVLRFSMLLFIQKRHWNWPRVAVVLTATAVCHFATVICSVRGAHKHNMIVPTIRENIAIICVRVCCGCWSLMVSLFLFSLHYLSSLVCLHNRFHCAVSLLTHTHAQL